MSYEQFKKDLEKAEIVEREVLKLLYSKFDKYSYKVEGNYKYYDLYSPNLSLSFEVKDENKGFKFIPIELKSDDKDSGLLTSKADFWVILIKDRFCFIEINKLKELILNKPSKKYKLTDNIKDLCLIPIYDIEKNSIYIFDRVPQETKV